MATLYVIGIGPGGEDHFTRAMEKAIGASEVLVGYTPYMAYLGDRVQNKEIISTGMKSEIERCKAAIDQVKAGKTTSIISTGDAGLYGMAGPILELAPEDMDIQVLPGVSANFASAARLGAPIMHDFVTISLSDLLTPWELILKRVAMAVEGDFVITIYNPRSKGRPNHLRQVLDLMMDRGIEGSRPVGIVKNAGREGEVIYRTQLDQVDVEVVDMLSCVIIGNSKTYWKGDFMVTPRGYENK
ncbi:MAG: precorrin-3B C(17)-methyltransferase [Tissierellia bacterium]|nr:precorrin-3B C(17)-methyltransferase [Tissierellia bacterium]